MTPAVARGSEQVTAGVLRTQRPGGAESGGIAGGATCALVESHKLYSPPGDFNNDFGGAVAISGSTAIVGADGNNAVASDAGAAYILSFDGSTWTLIHTLLAPDGAGGDAFGASVSFDGNLAVAGAPLDDHPGVAANAGSAYVFRHDGAKWALEMKLIASDTQSFDRFGSSVTVQGMTIIVGTPEDDDMATSAGAAYVFEFDGSTWVERQKLYASPSGQQHRFGHSVAIDGDRAVIGNGATSSTIAGMAHAFHHFGAEWTHQQAIVPSDGFEGDAFGVAVGISGDRLVVGAPQHPSNGTFSGAAYAFRFDGTTWTSQQKLVATDTSVNDQFGASVVIQGDALVVGAPLNTVQYTQGSFPGSFAGSGYLFRLLGGTWVERHRMNAHWIDNTFDPNSTSDDHLGLAAAIDDGVVMLGAPLDTQSPSKGSVLLFAVEPPDCDGDGVSDVCDPDCNHNLVSDICEVDNGVAGDCNANGAPDVCEDGFDYSLDSGTGFTVWGPWESGGDFIWLNQFIVQPGGEFITHIGVPWTGFTPEGTPGMLMLYDDPDSDGNPDDAVLLGNWPVVGHDAFGLHPILTFTIEAIDRTYVGSPGESFFVGAIMSCQVGTAVAAADNQPSQGRSWRALSPLGKGNIVNLSDNSSPIALHTNNNFTLRAMALDCNGNGNWDDCDIARGSSEDANDNGIPDECESMPPACLADIAGSDAVVDVNDLLLLIGAWGPCPAPPVGCPDLNGDGSINVNDLLLMIGA